MDEQWKETHRMQSNAEAVSGLAAQLPGFVKLTILKLVWAVKFDMDVFSMHIESLIYR